MRGLIRNFFSNESGQFGIMLGIMVTPIMMSVGGAMDYAQAMNLRKDLQYSIDVGTYAAAIEPGEEGARKAKGTSLFNANYNQTCSSAPEFSFEENTVRGTVTCAVDTMVLQIIGFSTIDIMAKSEVTLESGGGGGVNVLADACVIALSDSAPKAVNITGSGKVDFTCGIYSRSNSNKAAYISKSGDFAASSVATVGNYKLFSNAWVRTTFHTDMPVADDPLAGMAPPEDAAGGCDYTNKKINTSSNVTLSPGVYCGGLRISSSGHVKFESGVYVFRDGMLKYSASGNLTGEDVLLYFEGDSAFNISASGNVKLKGRQSGDYAGFTIAQSNEASDTATSMSFSMSGNSIIEGTIYLPRTALDLSMSGETRISAGYTAYITDTISMNASGDWRVFSDFESSTPLPVMLEESRKIAPVGLIARISG